jgi:hypothetical protein
MGPGLPELVGFSMTRQVASPGDTLQAIASWHAPAPLAPGGYSVAARFTRPLPGGLRPPALIAKPVRKLVEEVRGERYRFRADHLPVGGEYGVDLWRPDEVVRDSFSVILPRWLATGTYRVEIRMLRQPIYPILHLNDLLSDEDVYSGPPVATLELAPAPAGPPRPGAAAGSR